MEAIRERVEKALEKIRPYLVADGGDISVVDITKDMVVQVEMKGACNGCLSACKPLKLVWRWLLGMRFLKLRK